MQTKEQTKAIEAFLRVWCRKSDCKGDGPWCAAQAKVREAFGYPANWKYLRKIPQHHQTLKELSSKMKVLTKQELSLESLTEIAHAGNKIGNISSCLYGNHFKPPVVKLQRGDENYKERLKEVIGSGQDYVIVSEKGVTVAGGSSGSDFDDCFYISCDVCYPEKKEEADD